MTPRVFTRRAAFAALILLFALIGVMTGCSSPPAPGTAGAGTPGKAAPAVSTDEMVAKVKANPNIPDAQKEMLIKQIQEQTKKGDAAKPKG